MKTTKLFFMAALALMTAACSNDDNDLTTQQPQKAEGITITAQLAPKTGGATTRAVSDGGNKIVAEWAVDEHIAILYEVSSTKYVADATITAVDGSGAATIEFTVEAGTPDNTACTLVYPAKLTDGTTTVYKDDLSGVKDAATLLAAQDGTLSANLDVRVGAGTIQTTTPGLTVTTQPAAQFAIFKFTLQDLSAGAKSATEFKVSDGSGNVMTTVTPGSASGELYVALPVMAAGTYWFNATIDSKPYIAKATTAAATVAGKYYQTTVKMATIGDVLLSDGKFAAKGTDNEQAVIAYVGTVDNYFSHFLALALTDVDGDKHNWADALTKVGNYAAAHPVTIGRTTYNTSTTGDTYYDIVANDKSISSATATAKQTGWRLPSVTDWRYVFDGLGRIKGGLALYNKNSDLYLFPTIPPGICDKMNYRDGDDGSTLRSAINNACNGALQVDLYWSSSKYTDTSYAWFYVWNYSFVNGNFYYGRNEYDTFRYSRAVFAY